MSDQEWSKNVYKQINVLPDFNLIITAISILQPKLRGSQAFLYKYEIYKKNHFFFLSNFLFALQSSHLKKVTFIWIFFDRTSLMVLGDSMHQTCWLVISAVLKLFEELSFIYCSNVSTGWKYLAVWLLWKLLKRISTS